MLRNLSFTIVTLLVMLQSASGFVARADDGITLSVSPPLFKVDLNPGQTWKSSVKVVNNNAYETIIYADALDFISGPDGGVQFLPKGDDSHERYSLSKWMTLEATSTAIAAYGQAEIPFTLIAPQSAGPGGHYGAIMIGNKPFDNSGPGTAIKFSSQLASLLLVKFGGDVNESGEIKEFKTESAFTGSLNSDFTVRFTNTGNVHVRPTGIIKITNIFGDVRGEIQLNKSADYGNVLPESDKIWSLSWQGNNPILDAGPMRAELLMNYGSESKASATQSLYFWTVDWKPTVITFGSLGFIVLMIIWLIRRSIRKNVQLIKQQLEAQAPQRRTRKKQ